MARAARFVDSSRAGGRNTDRPPGYMMVNKVENLRVVVVDDSEDFLAGACAWVTGNCGMQVVGTAQGGREGVELVRRLRPDLVLMDAVMPDVDGFEAARRLKSDAGAPLLVILTFFDSQAARLEAWAAGADGFVVKSEVADQLLPVVRTLVGDTDTDDPGSRPDGALRPHDSSQPRHPRGSDESTAEREGAPEALPSDERRAGRFGLHARAVLDGLVRALSALPDRPRRSSAD